MYRKLIAACMALAAFAAFSVAPSIASAENNPLLTHPTGTALATGTKITGTNVGKTLFTSSAFNVECETASMTGELTENSGTTVRGDVTAASFSGTGTGEDCTSGVGPVRATPETGTNGLPWCLSSTPLMAEDEFQVQGGNCGSPRGIRFALDATSLGTTCTYERTAAISGTFTTHPEDAILTISEVEFAKIGGGVLCPSTGRLDMSFTLETDSATVSPMYIS